MSVQVSGKHIDVGDALRTRITDALQAGVGKYFSDPHSSGEADVFIGREGHSVCVDLVVRLPSGQRLESRGLGGDAHLAFDVAMAKVDKRIRRYKRRLNSHKGHLGAAARQESVALTVLSAPQDDTEDSSDYDFDDESTGDARLAGAVIAETQAELKTMTVSMAVMELDLTEAPVVMFRNVAHGGLSVVYRRADQNIGWIDPARTTPAFTHSKA
jgi:ribosomal subunit interface protein